MHPVVIKASRSPLTLAINCVRLICRAVRRYAESRKRAHVGYTVLIVAVEFAVIGILHDPTIHFSLAAAIAAWELLILSLVD